MLAFWQSFLFIALAEMGDKTQLVALAFATRFSARVVLGAIFVATLLVHLFSNRRSWVLLFPLAAMTFDLLENGTVAFMASTYAGSVPASAGAASVFTSTKLVFLLLSFLLVILGAIRGLFRRRA